MADSRPTSSRVSGTDCSCNTTTPTCGGGGAGGGRCEPQPPRSAASSTPCRAPRAPPGGAARLRAAQGDAIAAGAARLPAGALDAETTRQRYPEHGLFPPPYAGSYVTDARLALDFSFEIDFWGRNRALLAAARSGVEAAEADRAAARLALTVAVARAYVQLDLWYELLDVTNENLRQQSAILELTQQRVSAGL